MFNKKGMRLVAIKTVLLAGKELHSESEKIKKEAEEFFKSEEFYACAILIGIDKDHIYKTLKENKFDKRIDFKKRSYDEW